MTDVVEPGTGLIVISVSGPAVDRVAGGAIHPVLEHVAGVGAFQSSMMRWKVGPASVITRGGQRGRAGVFPVSAADCGVGSAEIQRPGERRAIGQERRSVAEEHRPIGEQRDAVAEEHGAVSQELRAIGQEHRPVGEQHMSVGQQHRSIGQQFRSVGQQSRSRRRGSAIHRPAVSTPSASSSAPSARSSDPSARNSDPSASSHEPSARICDPSARSFDPSLRSFTPSGPIENPAKFRRLPTWFRRSVAQSSNPVRWSRAHRHGASGSPSKLTSWEHRHRRCRRRRSSRSGSRDVAVDANHRRRALREISGRCRTASLALPASPGDHGAYQLVR